MRQIEGITTAIAELVFNKPSSRYEMQTEIRHSDSDLLYILLCNMLETKNINGAEDLLFDTIEVNNHDHFLIAVDFYDKLNKMTDKELNKADFSRNEIEQGLNEVKSFYGLSI